MEKVGRSKQQKKQNSVQNKTIKATVQIRQLLRPMVWVRVGIILQPPSPCVAKGQDFTKLSLTYCQHCTARIEW